MGLPARQNVARISEETGIHIATLYAWRKSWLLEGEVVPASQQDPEGWSAADTFKVVLESAGLNASEPSARLQFEPLHLANAGLVLLHPFLPQLFAPLGLLSTAAAGSLCIEGLEARSRAVHLLQWLVDGRLDRPEAELSLNKLLAGLDLAEPIQPHHDARDDDLAAATELLQAVIGHWPSLASTSIDGLRETFLQREGRLASPTAEANHWTLYVQRRTVDVLLNQLPWSFTLIKHRWLPLPLHVHW